MARKPVFPVADKKYGDEVRPEDTPIEDILKDMLPPESEPPSPTLEELGLNLNPDKPTVHAQVVFEEQEPPLLVPMQQTHVPPVPQPSTSPSQVPQQPLQFHSRITVTDAYQFDGRLAKAPAYIDRNWAAMVDNQPALQDPAIGVVRIGDWVLKQDIVDDGGRIEHGRIVAMSNEDFQKYFVRKAG